ncbi:MAG: transposase [Candidatus Lloydbacteria bacterium]|nr:transposase [Candidatus Lloydbacteria bacterium]
MRKVPFINNEFYHVYNRGVDKRDIFSNQYDVERFFQSMNEFNVIEPIGSIYENSFRGSQLGGSTSKLVNFIAYCLNSNHYHFLLEQAHDKGIEKFMHKLSTGYTRYFNDKNKRSGALFQGRFKSTHIDSNEYLLHVSAYINLNDRIHQLSGSTTKLLVKSSLGEYMNIYPSQDFCKKDMILGQFNTVDEYKIFAEETMEGIVEKRKEDKKLEEIFGE